MVVQMIFPCLAVNQDVITIRHGKVLEPLQSTVNEPLEGGSCPLEPKGHFSEVILTRVDGKGSLFLSFLI